MTFHAPRHYHGMHPEKATTATQIVQLWPIKSIMLKNRKTKSRQPDLTAFHKEHRPTSTQPNHTKFLSAPQSMIEA
jgi:hypothetical protein